MTTVSKPPDPVSMHRDTNQNPSKLLNYLESNILNNSNHIT